MSIFFHFPRMRTENTPGASRYEPGQSSSIAPVTTAPPQLKQTMAEPQVKETAPTPSISNPSKRKTWAENEHLMEQKVAAPQKSSEAQAHKLLPPLSSLETFDAGEHDPTGQAAQPGASGMPFTVNFWEDEATRCFQVSARGFWVTRREDNNMINGTKLLNVAGMTRGRRDGILKSERARHIVKSGSSHLKGIWIPFDRALDMANRERITDMLYPLFVHNVWALLKSFHGDAVPPSPQSSQASLDLVRQPPVQQKAWTSNGTARREQPPVTIQHKDIAEVHVVASNNNSDGSSPNGTL
ncbi:transcription regulator HTH, apses-type DNA-binding domain-containing protein [Chaetomium sp. MPI-CAGE-AT-0009]|nr:transcription regulator HTH, apses-type DNA-binding domain-containing protein [Chaetomium sp. MPI-CAGE-AT-0009]